VPRLTPLSKVTSRTIKVSAAPYALQHSTDGRYTFVTVHNGIAVLRNEGGLSLRLLHTVPLRGAGTGLVTTTDGHYLIAADGSGAAVLSVSALENGAAHPVLGMLTSPHGSGAATPILSADGQYLFVALAGSNDIAVFNFGLAGKSRFSAAHFIGAIPAGVQPTGMRLAVDQNYLYVTSLQRKAGKAPSEGTLSVIDVPEAEKDPAKSVKVMVNAGCSPERVYPTLNTVWVTARDSNAVLAFSASELLSKPSRALVAVVRIGPAPVGVTPLTDGRIVITDSGDAGTHDRSGNVAVISGDAALAGKPSLLGVVAVAGEPYQLTRIENHNTLLVTDAANGRLVALNVADMP
jgi:DNA-binding beta-propeller fold protein YncE